MSALAKALVWCAVRGRYLLVAGLLAGIFLEDLALALKPWIAEMVAAMLLIAAFRVGPKAAIGAAGDLRRSLSIVLAYQLVAPLILIGVFALAGFRGAIAAAIVLMAAGSSISGAPNLAILCNADPAPALRLLVVGTALLPLTVLPVFWLMPQLGGGYEVLVPAGRLLMVIGLCVLAGFLLRRSVDHRMDMHALRATDGLSAVAMMVVVIGLMAAVGPALRGDPGLLAVTLMAAFGANFGFQLIAYGLLKNESGSRVPHAIIAGNRNMALFLTALPANVTDPLLLFIGCYQIPMYLTPVLLGRLYRPSAPSA